MWIRSLYTAQYHLQAAISPRFNRRAMRLARTLIPYCLSPLDDDDESDTLILLNRDYKPLGIVADYTDRPVDYRDFPHLHASRHDPRLAELLTHCRELNTGYRVTSFYLFGDGGDSAEHGRRHAVRLINMLDTVTKKQSVVVRELRRKIVY
jgi:hypothetical protein